MEWVDEHLMYTLASMKDTWTGNSSREDEVAIGRHCVCLSSRNVIIMKYKRERESIAQ